MGEQEGHVVYELIFKPKSRLLLQLGDQLIKNEKIALSELVKNSYDACARYSIVQLHKVHAESYKSEGFVQIEDDGLGMDKEIIETIWMEPGTNHKEIKKNSYKSDEDEDSLDCKRIPIGEKGIGRFGVHKLGYKINLISKKKGSKEIELNIDWSQFSNNTYLSEEAITLIERDSPQQFKNGSTGTIIKISNLRKKWTKAEIRDVYRSIQSLTSPFESDDDFTVDFRVNDSDILKGLFDAEQLDEYKLWHFKCDVVQVDEKKTEIENFSYGFIPYSRMDTTRISARTVDQNNVYIDQDKLVTREVIKKVDGKNKTDYESIPLKGIGTFSIEGYIFDLDIKTIDLSNISDKRGFKNYLKENGGVRVYREKLRVYDYGEPENDWLGLDKKRVNDPGTSIGNNQIVAAIGLSMQDSRGLIEKTNREGFVDSEAYTNFKEAVKYVLDKVAFLRNEDKDKIRAIHVKEVDTTESTYSLINTLKSDIKISIQDTGTQNRLIGNIDKIQENYEELKELLLKSSGTGLTYGIVTHQMQKIVSEIKHRVKGDNDEALQSLVNSLDATIESIMNLFVVSEKDDTDVVQFIKREKSMFNYRLKKHGIQYVQAFDNELKLNMHIAENFVAGSVLNIIDNAIYWLDYWFKTHKPSEQKMIRIDLQEEESFVNLIFSDNGLGFLINPETAVMPFKTTKKLRDRGTGIGLYYVSEAMKINEGRLYIPTTEEQKLSLGLSGSFLRGATIVLKLPKKGN